MTCLFYSGRLYKEIIIKESPNFFLTALLILKSYVTVPGCLFPFAVICVQDHLHLPSAGGAGESVQRGSLSRCLRQRDALHEDGAARGQNTGVCRCVRDTGM